MVYDMLPKALLPSLMDRLLDPDSPGTATRPWYSVEQLAQTVRRDLVALLNSRQTQRGLCDEYPECCRSLLAYGLPDLPSLEAYTAAQCEAIGHRIEQVIQLFEPRLDRIRVRPIDSSTTPNRTVHFVVEATLRLDPAPDVAFEVILELATGQYDVETRPA